MSTEQAIPPRTLGPENKWDKLLRYWGYARLGHEGMMLDKIQRQTRIVEVLARNAATGDVEDMRGWPGTGDGDDMGVNIGNEIHYHGGNGAERPSTALPATAEQPKKNWLLPLALAGALGTGAAIPLAMDALRPDATPAVTEPVEIEFPQYDVERWVPE